MERTMIIAELKKQLPEDILNGTYSKNGKTMPTYEFLDSIFIRFIKDDAKVENLMQYLQAKILPDVIPRIDHNKKYEEYIEQYMASRDDLVATIRISETELISTRDFFMSKIPFMDDDFMVTVGPHKKTLDELYITLLNNEYHPATLAEKAELCASLSNFLSDEVLDSTMDGMSMSVRTYINEILPTIMINATDIVIGGKNVSVDSVVAKIDERQKEIINEQRQRELEERIERFNRTGENPSLLSEIQVALAADDSLEITTNIPVVASSQLSLEEVAALQSMKRDELYSNPRRYYKTSLDNLKDSIAHTNNAHDLESKASEFNALVSNMEPSLAAEYSELITSIAELVVAKRNDIIKIDNNKEEYGESLIDRIAAVSKQIRTLDNVDSFSEVKVELHSLERELIEKGITDISVWQVLRDAQDKLKRYSIRFNLTSEDFEVEKNNIISSVNDKLSIIRRNLVTLASVADERDIQRINIDIDVKSDAIANELAEGLKDKKISEADAKKLSDELTMVLSGSKSNKNELGL